MFISEITGQMLADTSWLPVQDTFSIRANMPTVGFAEGVPVATFYHRIPIAERRSLAPFVIAAMNKQPVAQVRGVWTVMPRHSIALNGYKVITVSSYLSESARVALLSLLCTRQNA